MTDVSTAYDDDQNFDDDAAFEDEGFEDEGFDGEQTVTEAAAEPVFTNTEPAVIHGPRVLSRAPLRDFDIAPENIRFGEEADEDIPQLAETIAAAGVLQPLQTRRGKKKERAHMALDGRRRLLALNLLLQAGRIDDSYEIEFIQVSGKDGEAAAAMLTNTQSVPVHIADVIVAIGKMLKRKMAPATIAKALGYTELEVRRWAALSDLHPVAVAALKKGAIRMNHARMLARLPDKQRQASICERVMAGENWAINEIERAVDQGRMTIRNRMFALLGVDAYAAAGGRLENDLFGELPAAVLDTELVSQLWQERATTIAKLLDDTGVQFYLAGDRSGTAPEGYEYLGYVYGQALSDDQKEQLRTARTQLSEARQAVAEAGAGPQSDEVRAAAIRAELAEGQAQHPTRTIGAVALYPDPTYGIGITYYANPKVVEPRAEDADGDDGLEAYSSTYTGRTNTAPEVEVPQPEVETEGLNHALHITRTGVATRGLIRALADNPGVALSALIARMFVMLALRGHTSTHEAALAITAKSFGDPTKSIASLDGIVRERLAARRLEYLASGLRPIPWVDGLPHGTKMELLAELTALTLDVQEIRTDNIRKPARADAADIAELCGAVITDHWTPDEPFVAQHGKKLLLGMLEEMGGDVARAKGAKKDEVVDLVVEEAEARRWAPAALDFRFAAEVAEDDLIDGDEVTGEVEGEGDAAADDQAGADEPTTTGGEDDGEPAGAPFEIDPTTVANDPDDAGEAAEVDVAEAA